EMLTIKSDDVPGRSKAYEAIIKGEEIEKLNVPESFNVLIRELKGLGLSVELLGGSGGGGLPASEVVTDLDLEIAETPKDERFDHDKPEIIAVDDRVETQGDSE
ncbi:hypothetical protein CVU83_02225, partial [Candidatus Falkowbacteria bacterium HGW-Falkowbacteria-2]